MESRQRVIRRSLIFSTLLQILVGISLLLLGYVLVRQNLSQERLSRWPWKLQLLDVQSATTALLGTVGALLARAQYARSIRPSLGYFGRVTSGMAPRRKLTWACFILNGGQDVAIVADVAYQVRFTSSARAVGTVEAEVWISGSDVVGTLTGHRLVAGADFAIDIYGAGRPLPPQVMTLMGWFTQRAMSQLEHVYVRVRVVDRVGDVHERIIDLLKNADRTPVRVNVPPF